MVEFSCGAVLRNCNVHASVAIIVANRRASLFAVDRNATFRTGKGTKLARSSAEQAKATPGIVAGGLACAGEKILAQEEVFIPIAIQVCGTNSKGCRGLRLHWQR